MTKINIQIKKKKNITTYLEETGFKEKNKKKKNGSKKNVLYKRKRVFQK